MNDELSERGNVMRSVRVMVALVLASVAAPSLCAAQAAAGAKARAASPVSAVDNSRNHPEWTGLYRMAKGAELAGFKPEFPDDAALDAEIYKHLQPWARLKLEQTNGVADDTGAVCQLDGIFRMNLRGAGFMWLPAGNKIILLSSNFYSGGIRNVYLDRPHPKYPPATWGGHSIGRWEGDELVVDTVGFNDKTWLTSSMQPHTEEMHVIERHRMVAKNLMEVRYTVEDRQALTSPFTHSRFYVRVADEVREVVCNPEPGDQRMWTEFRNQALKHGMLPLRPKE